MSAWTVAAASTAAVGTTAAIGTTAAVGTTAATAPDAAVSFAEADALLRSTVDLGAERAPGAGLERTLADYRRLGLPPGTLVGVGLPNGTDLLTHYFAIVLAGLVPLLAAPSSPPGRVAQLAGHLNMGAYVAPERIVAKLGDGRTHRVGARQLALLHRAEPHPERYRPGDVVMLTSGTSGIFSACMNRFDALLRNARRHNLATGVRPGDAVLVVLPLYYSYALVAQALSALAAGARLVIGRPPFRPDGYRAAITEHGIDVSSVTPALARQFTAQGAALPHRLRTLTVGGDQLTERHVGELLALHHGELYLTYGLTEAGPRVATLAAHREPRAHWRSVGLPLPQVGVSLREVRPDGVGELVVESDTVLSRKVGQVRSQPLLAPGRIATGDLFSMNAAGYLFFEGRLRDFVVVRGEKVSLFAMRQAAESLPGIACARPQVSDGDGDPVVELVVYAADPSRTTAEAVRRQLGRLLMRGELPHRVSVLAADGLDFHK